MKNLATRIFALSLFVLAFVATANLLKNPSFADKKGWVLQPASNIVVDENGVASLTAGETRTYLQQVDTPLVNGMEYLFTVDYRSDDATKGLVYLEKSDPWHGGNISVKGAPQWQTASFRFKAQNERGKYYAVLSTDPNAQGVMQYRNPEITLIEDCIPSYKANAVNLLQNPSFADDGRGWSRSATSDVTVLDNGIVRMSGDAEKRVYLLQHDLEFIPSGHYVFSVFFRGTPGLKAQFYLERGVPAHTAIQDIYPSEDWQLCTFDFTAKPGNNYYAVLSIPKGESGEVEFTRPIIEFQAGTLLNGNFQAMATAWDFTNASIHDFSDAKYGLSVELDGREENASIRQGGLTITKGKIYRLAYDVRGGTDKKYTDIQGATWSRIAVLDDQGQVIPECAGWRDCFATWQHKEVTFVAQKDMFVSLQGELKDPGVVYFDNISFSETQSELPLLEIVLDAPFSYHNGVIVGDGATDFSCAVYSALRGQQLVISFNGEERSYPGDLDVVLLNFAVPEKLGTTPIEAKLLDDKGNILATATLPFTVRPKQPRSFFFDQDKVFHIDGKPVFPVMSWGNRGDLPTADAMKAQAAMGFNLMLCTTHTIESVAENGMMAMVQMPSTLFRDCDDQEILPALKGVAQEYIPLKDHPSLAAWFLVDEPAWRGESVTQFHKAYRRLLEYIDDTRPVFLNEAPRGTIENIRPYSLACDVYGVDIYPIPGPNTHSDLEDKMASSVGKYTDICQEVVRGQKPVWMTLQGFAWGAFNNATEVIYPTRQESRFMAYDSFAHGAMGLVYWGLELGSTQNDKFVQDLTDVIHEVLSVSAILIAPNATQDLPTASKKELLVCKKSNEAGTLWIILNETDKACKATITGEFPKTLQVLSENRTVNVKDDGSFRDEFPAYSVHVYFDAAKPLPAPLKMPATKRLTERVELPQDYRKANWIWYPGLEKTDNAQAIFRIPVKVEQPLEHAVLQVAADDAFVCTINGKEVMRQKDWSCVWTLDIAKFLQPGDNEILLQGIDLFKAPCGILFALGLSDGRMILSDGSIECRAPKTSEWIPAKVLAPFGGRPWVLPDAIPYTKPTLEILELQ